MSLAATLDRIAELQGLLRPQPQPVATASAPQETTFTRALALAGAGAPVAAAAAAGGTMAGRAALAAAQAELAAGVAEQPPGSNESPRIAEYRKATAGAPGPGPWCAYFVSWASRQAGAPLGDMGQGFGRVDDVWAWAERTGRTSGAARPGDLIVWDEHIGIVEAVAPDGSITTIEGNSSDRVARRTYGPDGGGAVGFVRIG